MISLNTNDYNIEDKKYDIKLQGVSDASYLQLHQRVS
jgi:hypothetical protein